MSLESDDPYGNVLNMAYKIRAMTSPYYPNVSIAVHIYLIVPCSVCK